MLIVCLGMWAYIRELLNQNYRLRSQTKEAADVLNDANEMLKNVGAQRDKLLKGFKTICDIQKITKDHLEHLLKETQPDDPKSN